MLKRLLKSVRKVASFIKSILILFLPAFTDTNVKGQRKVSIGRAPLLCILITMCYHYAKTGQEPGTGILTFVGMAMAYNGFSKTKYAGGNGGESTEDEELLD